jgi:hypothetical protein
MVKPRLQWCKHACEAGCAIHDRLRPDICTQFQCYWKMSIWSEELRPDRCGAIFRLEPDIRTLYGNKRRVFVADLRDPYANLRRVMSRHLKCLYEGGHIVCVSHTAVNNDDSVVFWRFKQSLYPGLTDGKLMRDYVWRHASAIAQQQRFYDNHAATCGCAAGVV